MSESVKGRIGKLEAAAMPDGPCCQSCGRLLSDEKERLRLNAEYNSANPFDEKRFAELYRSRILKDRENLEDRARQLLAGGWRPQ